MKTMKFSHLKPRNHRNICPGPGTLLLVIAVLTAFLVTGCTSPVSIPSSTGSPAVTAASTPWSGSWDSDWGTMEFIQSGDQVTGTYPHDNGRIKGTVSGNTLTGTWSESPTYNPPKDAGDVLFTLAADGKSFTGKWRYGSGSGKWDGDWEATRK
jgi:uncharacterized protein YceK